MITGLDILKIKLSPLLPYLRQGSIKEIDIAIINKLLSEITFFTSPIFRQSLGQIQRVTINKRVLKGENERIHEIGKLKYPPAECVTKYGRANLIGQSIMYATTNPITAMAEMKPNIGDLITTSTWKPKTSSPVDFVAICMKQGDEGNNIYNEFSMKAFSAFIKLLETKPEQEAKQLYELVKFITACFSKEVDDENHFDYYLSAHFANKIFTDFGGHNVDAIVYPSVRERFTSSNICLKAASFDEHYELYEVNEEIVSGVGLNRGTGWSKKFDGAKILWTTYS